MIIIGLDGAVYEAPKANAWTVEDGVLSIVATDDDGMVTNEYGVFASWDYVCDSDDVTLQAPLIASMPTWHADGSTY